MQVLTSAYFIIPLKQITNIVEIHCHTNETFAP